MIPSLAFKNDIINNPTHIFSLVDQNDCHHLTLQPLILHHRCHYYPRHLCHYHHHHQNHNQSCHHHQGRCHTTVVTDAPPPLQRTIGPTTILPTLQLPFPSPPSPPLSSLSPPTTQPLALYRHHHRCHHHCHQHSSHNYYLYT